MLDTHASPSRSTTDQPQSMPSLMGRLISNLSDRTIVVGFALLVILVTGLPYMYAYQSAPADRVYNGIMQDVPDTLQYFSWLRDHRTAWLVSNRMTPEQNTPALFNLLWLIVGRIEALTGWSVAALFQALRIVAAFALLLVLWSLCGFFTRSRAERWTAYLVIALGAGLGWIWIVEKYLFGRPDPRFPLDVFVAEPNTLLIILGFPHFVVATTLIMAIFALFLLLLQRANWLYGIAAALAALFLTLQHAYDLLIIGLIPAGALLLMLLRDRRIPWRGVGTLALVGLVATPPAAYFTVLTTSNPLWRRVLAQFANAGVYTPPLPRLLIVMGIPLVVILVALCWDVARYRPAMFKIHGSDSDLLLWSWFVVGFALLYVPTDFQIHMFTAWQIPVGLLAVRVLYRRLVPFLTTRQPLLARYAPAILLLLVLPTTLYLLSWRFVELRRHEAPYYLSTGEDAALHWLEANTTHETVVLSGLALGQYVPARSDARAFLAHWAQTVDFFQKQAQVREFFSQDTDDEARMALLREFAVNYVIYGNEERSLGNYAIDRSPLFEAVFRSDEVTIFRVHDAVGREK